MKFGIALGMTPDGLKSVANIMEEHIAIGDKFYFSTSYRFDKEKISQIEIILFYSKAENVFYLGNIDRFISYGLDESRPTNAREYSPKAYAEIPKRNWILVSKVKQVELEDLRTLNHKGLPVNEMIKAAKRSTLFYFTTEE